MLSFLMPMPVSVTVKIRFTLPSAAVPPHWTESVTEPSRVYFTALLSTLMRICFTRTSSPMSSAGTSGATLTRKSRPFSRARLQNMPAGSESMSAVR